MKKIAIFIVCLISIISIVAFKFNEYKIKQGKIEEYNLIYKQAYNKEINGNELATIINKTLDNNEQNHLEKDEKGIYVDNNENSIKAEIKFKQSDNIFPIELIYQNQVSKFINLYGQAKFKCTKLEYHKKTKLVKYLYFEEI